MEILRHATSAPLLAIVGGGLSEAISEPRRPKSHIERVGKGFSLVQGMGQTISHQLRAVDGTQEVSGQSRAETLPPERLVAQIAKLEALREISVDGSWEAWPCKKVYPRRLWSLRVGFFACR